MTTMPRPFYPSSDDWLNRPLDESTIDRATSFWAQRKARASRWNLGCMVGSIVLFVPGALMMFGAPENSATQIVGGVVLVSGALVMLLGTVHLTLLSVASSWAQSFRPLAAADQAKFDWLLEHTPAATALRQHLRAFPRAAREGELFALNTAYGTKPSGDDDAIRSTHT